MKPAVSDNIRVLVADDSAIVRGLISRMIESDSNANVVESVANGNLAIRALQRRDDIDVVILDIEMPEMNGLEALPQIVKIRPGLPVIMASTLTQRNAAISLEALDAGAADYIPKPTAGGLTGSNGFRHELLTKIKALGGAWRQRRGGRCGCMPLETRTIGSPTLSDKIAPAAPAAPTAQKVPLRRQSARISPKVISIGCSTGGPQALLKVLQELSPTSVRQPILITQHMPAAFTKILADRISRLSPWNCAEAEDGELLQDGRAYLAPGDYHMLVENGGRHPKIRLTQEPPVNFCRPAVDCTFASLPPVFGGRVVAVILTGMGADGYEGSRKIVAEGGTIIAQDSATSVVWGMPGAVAQAGLCSAVLPIDDIPRSVASLANGGAA